MTSSSKSAACSHGSRAAPGDRPRVGISRCLLGDGVRYDGGHKRDASLISSLAPLVDWVPVCPELEVGMGVPREPIHLVASATGVPSGNRRVRLLGVTSAEDWTSRMAAYSRRRVRELARANLAGYVLKAGSPSCGMESEIRPGLISDELREIRPGLISGPGLFAEAVLTGIENLPVEEETRLDDPAARASFIERVFAYQRVTSLFASRWGLSALVRFHTVHKLQLLSHSRAAYEELGRLVAKAKIIPRRELATTYERVFMRALERHATPGRHADVLMHALGHLKRALDDGERRKLVESIESYRRGRVRLVVPLTRVGDCARKYNIEYLCAQSYFDHNSWM